jgi:hypothetical protein
MAIKRVPDLARDPGLLKFLSPRGLRNHTWWCPEPGLQGKPGWISFLQFFAWLHVSFMHYCEAY